MDSVATVAAMAVTAARLDEPGSKDAVQQAIAGDEAAFRWIVETYTPDMRRVDVDVLACRIVLGSPASRGR
jgi:hypothetical protein